MSLVPEDDIIYTRTRRGLSCRGQESRSFSEAPGMAGQAVLVAAIDFGTSNTGLAYALRADYPNDRLGCIKAACFNDALASDVTRATTDKVPNTLLLTPEGKPDSFGYEAEKKFAELCSSKPEEAQKWYYFENFKMKLYNTKNLTRSKEIQDHWKRRTMPAITIIATSLDFMRRRLLKQVANLKLKDDDVDWVLTVPAIWDDKAKQFMRLAAEAAGIPGQRLTLAYEPEAAAVFCHRQGEATAGGDGFWSPNKRFMVLDCGGGTVDVTVYEVTAQSELKELQRPTGGDWGGTKVNEAFFDYIYRAVGFANVAAINTAEMIELSHNFEKAKVQFKGTGDVFIRMPPSVKVLFTETDMLQEGQLRIDKDTFRGFFKGCINATVKHVKSLLDPSQQLGVQSVVMVGGFSQSPLLREAVKKALPPGVKLVVPENGSASILRGAVLYKMDPRIVSCRALPFTYGIETTRVFNSDLHDKTYQRREGGMQLCTQLFYPLIRANEIVPVGKATAEKDFHPIRVDASTVRLKVYRTLQPIQEGQTAYTDKCESLGCINIESQRPGPGDKELDVQVSIILGDTELSVKAMENRKGKVFHFNTSFDFLHSGD